MFKNRWLVISLTVALIVFIAYTIREAVDTSGVVEAQSALSAREADVARWAAMGEVYAARQAAVADPSLRAREVDVARWVAMGEAYAAREPSAQISLSADVARWVAVGEVYTARLASSSVSQAFSARWASMGDYYIAVQALEAERMQRGREADAARWVAMGEACSKR